VSSAQPDDAAEDRRGPRASDALEPGDGSESPGRRASGALETVDIVLFEIGGAHYGADLTQVRRIDHLGSGDSFGHPLGTPRQQARTLVFANAEGYERRLAVDAVLGVRTVPVTELRRMPPAVAAPRTSIGAWLDKDSTVLLVDLLAFDPPASETPPKGSDHG